MKLENLKNIKSGIEITKFADIAKSNKEDENDIRYEPHKKQNGEKTVYAEVVDGEISHVFESGNFKANLQRYYKSQESVKKGDKPSDTNRAKYLLTKKELDQGKKVEIYIIEKCTKNELLETIKQIDGKYPPKNFQKNKEKIPENTLKVKKD